MIQIPSRLGLESAEVPAVIERQNRVLAGQIAAVLSALRRKAPRLVVTCGFFDAWHFLATEHRLALRREAEQLITVVTPDGRVLRELVKPEQLARRARELHVWHRATEGVAHV